MEWKGGMEMEWNDECTQFELIRVTGTVQSRLSYLLYMSQGLLSHHRGCSYVQIQCCRHTSFSGIMMSQSENEVSLNQGSLDPSTATNQLMTSYSNHAWGPHLLLLGKAITKIVRAKSD